MNKEDVKQCKKNILKYLSEDFDKNQALFRPEGYQIFNDTDLTMVMDKVVAGLLKTFYENSNK